ncbi:multifunctional transcriptional regulator/nicotinamide-nucleotide adenylyltransferase/ribosylnicotinamide kinase NadR [Lederbergia lenta]|uniref:Trifunctional NAD biosynthesis/regulator protein NadR n=1 Tax=Lederbergia lenta TaxID=1467 RepID=A0A2X4ZBR2_LEDLE|nr:multifunctional transcriptional regulator/nicotinamide-nucleotide adenylyltransferase/ribosylnicotinamide kinase NadR [Lederbergia lenta]MCM3111703.1 multifunctional transcriptional regulator/nicotinamide-nucleotide adenylyltransferase/ribosylnicotinamide kinase NadR [Lederbergia lenta]MEC2322856.1 multifunctional transcriptional regulator/nicotinamide-nucleotide adenylyltransferase/ribosylnicotinamide kinase NadR [Lederbergia lenta]SQI61925.1 Trifunctional NAD biosynthesis/regulator protein 
MKKVGMYGGKFLPVHQGHVNAMTIASTMVDELHIIVSYDEEYEKRYFENSSLEPIPYKQRLRWWSQMTKQMDHVYVHAVKEKQTGSFSDWEEGARQIKQAVGKEIDVVFSSEKNYSPTFEKLYPQAVHEIIDNERIMVDISATRIREEGVYQHWEMIPEEVRPYFVKKVVVVGTESCGKSTLVKNLARIFNTRYVEEYGRTYYEKFKDCVSVTQESDYHEIAFEQKYHEKMQAERANKVLFIDTEAIVTQYYSELYVNKNQEILTSIAKLQDYDLYLFLEPDVVWVDDGTRVHGEQYVRDENNQRLKKMLNNYGVNFHEINGSYYERLKKSRQLVESIL